MRWEAQLTGLAGIDSSQISGEHTAELKSKFSVTGYPYPLACSFKGPTQLPRLKACSRRITLLPLAIGLFYQRMVSNLWGAYSRAEVQDQHYRLPSLPARYPFNIWVR
jgi:hypothetical protein